MVIDFLIIDVIAADTYLVRHGDEIELLDVFLVGFVNKWKLGWMEGIGVWIRLAGSWKKVSLFFFQ